MTNELVVDKGWVNPKRGFGLSVGFRIAHPPKAKHRSDNEPNADCDGLINHTVRSMRNNQVDKASYCV